MKKTRFLVLVLAVSVMLVGAGYAFWTDQLKITSTVQTGELNVTFTQLDANPNAPKIKASEYVEVDVQPYAPPGSYPNIPYTDALTFTIKNMYPGAKVQFHLGGKNEGTISAKLQSMELIPNNSNNMLYNALQYKLGINKSLPNWPHFGVSNGWQMLTAFNSVSGAHPNLSNIVLIPQEGFNLADLEFTLPDDGTVQNDLMNKSCTFTIYFNWIQAVDGVSVYAETPNDGIPAQP